MDDDRDIPDTLSVLFEFASGRVVEFQVNEAHGDLGIKENSSAILIGNFLDCVIDRSVRPYCSLEDGHRSTSFAHLANIALETGERLRWDADAERFTNNEAANQMLHYEYREPWSLN